MSVREAVAVSGFDRLIPLWGLATVFFPTMRSFCTPGDVIASSVLRHMTEDCGMRVGHLADVSSEIFNICNEHSRAVLQDRILVLDASRNTCALLEDASSFPTDNAVVVCPLAPIIQAFQDALTQSHPVREQTRSYFSPTPVGREPAVRSRSK